MHGQAASITWLTGGGPHTAANYNNAKQSIVYADITDAKYFVERKDTAQIVVLSNKFFFALHSLFLLQTCSPLVSVYDTEFLAEGTTSEVDLSDTILVFPNFYHGPS